MYFLNCDILLALYFLSLYNAEKMRRSKSNIIIFHLVLSFQHISYHDSLVSVVSTKTEYFGEEMPANVVELRSGRKTEGNYSTTFAEEQNHFCWKSHRETK